MKNATAKPSQRSLSTPPMASTTAKVNGLKPRSTFSDHRNQNIIPATPNAAQAPITHGVQRREGEDEDEDEDVRPSGAGSSGSAPTSAWNTPRFAAASPSSASATISPGTYDHGS